MLLEKQSLSQSRISLTFIEHESLFPFSQEPDAGPCPEPDESSPQLPALFIYDPFLYYPSVYA
jgi:hypothetical protein